MDTQENRELIAESRRRLKGFIVARGCKGYDPFDALNSPLISFLSLRSGWMRLFFTQAMKRLPWNLRPVLGIRPIEDPKGYALYYFGCAACAESADAEYALGRILALRFCYQGKSGWGYSFPWMGIAHGYWPVGTVTAIPTIFACRALLQAARKSGKKEYSGPVREAVDSLLAHHLMQGSRGRYISYFPGYQNLVHNVNALAAALLAEAGSFFGEKRYSVLAAELARTVSSWQLEDGSWYYGTHPRQRWMDSYHQGYILEGLSLVSDALKSDEWKAALAKGLEFWRGNFLKGKDTVLYYPGRDYPVDPHAYACAALVLLRFEDMIPDARGLAESLALRMIKEMQKKDGSFYYLKTRLFTYDITHMRWTQMWMFYCLSALSCRKPG